MATGHQDVRLWRDRPSARSLQLRAESGELACSVTANLDTSGDWIVTNCTLEALGVFARTSPAAQARLVERLRNYQHSGYKSVAARARKLLAEFDSEPPRAGPPVRTWTSWHRWVTLAMVALAFLTIAAATEHATRPPPPGQIPLTRPEIARLFTALTAQPDRRPRHLLSFAIGSKPRTR